MPGRLLSSLGIFRTIVNLIGPEASVRMSGSGCCMLEVETNGGFKVIGILGCFRMEIPSAGNLRI